MKKKNYYRRHLESQLHRCREQTYGHQGGKAAGGVGDGVCDDLGDWG